MARQAQASLARSLCSRQQRREDGAIARSKELCRRRTDPIINELRSAVNIAIKEDESGLTIIELELELEQRDCVAVAVCV